MKSTAIKSPLEKEVQNAVLEFLMYKKIFCWRNNNVGLFNAKSGSFMRMPKYAMKGISDILGILPNGTFFAIEIKRDKSSKPTEDQVEFIRNIIRNKGIAFVATSIEDVEKNLFT